MKYDPEAYGKRGVDPRLLGQLLSADAPINADYINAHECSCRPHSQRNSQRYTRQSTQCRDMQNTDHMHNHSSCHNSEQNDARLGSACAGTPSLAMAYSPFQYFQNVYDAEEGLWRGTIFKELDKPWKVGGCR